MDEKRCMLCNKPYNYKYEMFGRGCLEKLYDLLGFPKSPRIIWNKELYLCTRIAWRNHKFFLSKKKKYVLAQKYIALTYLNMMNYESLNDIEEKISNDIKNITIFSKNIIETISFSLNEIYKLFNYTNKFNKLLEENKDINWKEIDEKVAENFIKDISFIFDVTKITSPVSYVVFYSMQYIFWQVVVVGGILTNKPLSAKLLSNSLVLFGKEPQDLEINDEKTIKDIEDDEEFKKRIKELIEKYGKETGKFNLKDYEKDGALLSFEGGDLLYALHDATMFVNAQKNDNNTWNLEIEINDTYDFTDFKELKEYVDREDSKLTDIFSTLLNNFGVASSKYGVIKEYDVKIRFNLNNYVVEY